MARLRSEAVDRAIRALFEPVAAAGMALVAVGGYGRGHLSPGSDVDLLLLRSAAERVAADAFERVLYPLWDARLRVGHALRTPHECVAESRGRPDVLASMLTPRLLAGDPALAGEAGRGVRSLAEEDRGAFVAALGTWFRERGADPGPVDHTIEPDLKQGQGGLRDLHILTLLARDGPADPVDDAFALPGLLSEEEARWAHDAAGLLLRTREALQRLTGGEANRLLAEHHDAVAAALGIASDGDGWEPRDVLVRELCRHGRRVRLLVEAALARAEDADPAAPSFGAALEDDGPPAASGDGGPRSRLLSLLASDEGGRALERLDARGSLAPMLPEWEGVRGRPQRDPYHRYPVDVHLTEAVAHARRLLRDPGDPFLAEAARMVRDAEGEASLLLGALLHDIGKVGRGSHVTNGVDAAGRALDRMGAAPALRDDVLFLVGEHLLLSHVATRRDLQDEDLILHVAARIGDERRLALLYLLTVADAHATGPVASTPWRMGLVKELVAKVGRAFERGLMDVDRAAQLASAERAFREALGSQRSDEVEAFLASAPPAYLLWAQPADAPRDLRLVRPRPAPEEARVDVRPGPSPGTWLVMVGAVDRLGLLAGISGALSLAGLSIVSARAFTTEDGLALDAFVVRGTHEDDLAAERGERFEELLRSALTGEVDLSERLRAAHGHRRPGARSVPVSVRMDHGASDFTTVVEVEAPDRVGLLYDLARSLGEEGVDVHSAKVATYGSRVLDVFYVTARGEKLDPDRAEALRVTLSEAASPRLEPPASG